MVGSNRLDTPRGAPCGRGGRPVRGTTPRPTRRDVLRGAAAAVAAGAWAGSARAARPVRGSGVIALTFQAQWNAPWNPTARAIANRFVEERFNQTHPGLRASLWPTGSGGADSIIAAAIAGAPTPDVVADCCEAIPLYLDSGWLLPLDDYLRRDNVPLTLWSREHVQALNIDGLQYGLPSYEGPQVMVYRKDLLDDLGLPVPEPTWTYQEAADLWAKCVTVHGSQFTAGASLEWFTGIQYLLKGFGGTLMDETRTRCLLDLPESIAAGEWFYDLLFRKVIIHRNDTFGLYQNPPLEVFSMVGGWDVFSLATNLGYKFEWDILPVPTWPKGFATFVNSDFYGINRATRYPDAAWELLKWIAVEPEWTRFEMQTTLTEPALLSLWDEWEAVVTAAAPPLRGKALHYFKDAALSGRTYPHLFFRYGGVRADNLIWQGLGQIESRQVSVALGFQEIARQVTAYEEAAAAARQQASSLASLFPTRGPAVAIVPPDQ
jgi:multiple sugar transport system substrate-binding protein